MYSSVYTYIHDQFISPLYKYCLLLLLFMCMYVCESKSVWLMKMDDYHTKAVCYCAFLCVGYVNDNHNSIAICWPLPNNQDFYRQIAGYGMGQQK